MRDRIPDDVSSTTEPLPFDDVMRALIAECWRDLWKALPSRKALADPEAIHDVRVAARRLRSAMDLATAIFPQRWFRQLHLEATSIADAFGTLRDADVMLETLHSARTTAPWTEHTGFDDLIAQQEGVRAEAIVAARRSLRRLEQRRVRQASRKRFSRLSRTRRIAMHEALAAQGAS